MAFIPVDNRLGIQPIPSTSSVQNHDLGTLVRGRDQLYGEGEFLYLVGVAGTQVGSVVIWEGVTGAGVPTYQTILAPATANLGQPVAVAMSANVGGQFGWYQIVGTAVCKTNGTLTAPNAAVYLAGSGQLTSTAAAGLRVEDALSITASGTPSSGLALVEIDKPFGQAQDSVAVRVQRQLAGSGDLPIQAADAILNINISAGLAITVPLYSTRAGSPLTFKNLAASTAVATLNRTSPDTFDGQTSLVVNPGQSITLQPANDGVNTGYEIT